MLDNSFLDGVISMLDCVLYLCHGQVSSLPPFALYCAPLMLCLFEPLWYPVKRH